MKGSLALAVVIAAAGCRQKAAPAPTPSPPTGNTAYVGPATPTDAAAAPTPTPAVGDPADAASRAYDRLDFEQARALALQVLATRPGDVRMLRLVVSSACMLGDVDQARAYWSKLPPRDQDQMSVRCTRYGIKLQ